MQRIIQKERMVKWYFYYRCENCKNNIKETGIEESIKNILSDILEYDNVVYEFFLPMLKNKLDFSPFFKKGDVPIRVFPLQKDTGKDLSSMGMIVTKENTLDVKVDNLRDLFK